MTSRETKLRVLPPHNFLTSINRNPPGVPNPWRVSVYRKRKNVL
jgi:hypothetical protein